MLTVCQVRTRGASPASRFKQQARWVDVTRVDLWDWLGSLVCWILELIPPKWLWLLLLATTLVVWWLYVPYFQV